MKLASFFLALLLSGMMMATSSIAQSSEDWVPIKEKAELQNLLSGKGLEGLDYYDYYRSDGAMGYFNKSTETVIVRKWVVDHGGTVCTYIYVKPDRLVDCATFARSSADPELVRMTILDRGDVYHLKISAEPPPKLIDAINKTAGPAG